MKRKSTTTSSFALPNGPQVNIGYISEQQHHFTGRVSFIDETVEDPFAYVTKKLAESHRLKKTKQVEG